MIINCIKCGSKNIYTTSEERVCRRCGCRWKIKEKDPKGNVAKQDPKGGDLSA